MKFPTYKELGEIAAKEALDTFEYKGKTLREWIEIISSAELGTNLAEVGTDLISRQAVTKFLNDWLSCLFENCHKQSASDLKMIIKDFKNLPSAQPDTTIHDSIPTETGKNDGDGTSGDCISRTQAIDKFIDGLEEIFADLRERHVDDSVCGLCEYDGAYMGQSGDWCNECPGFDRDDCFKLSDKTRKRWTDKIIKALPSIQPERKTGHWILDRSGAYCCDKCMEPCATYIMMKPRDKFCKMCGSRNEVME